MEYEELQRGLHLLIFFGECIVTALYLNVKGFPIAPLTLIATLHPIHAALSVLHHLYSQMENNSGEYHGSTNQKEGKTSSRLSEAKTLRHGGLKI